MNLENTYEQLTSIDIEEQKDIWDDRGKGYYGEYLLFCELYKRVAGTGKILMNLNVPVDSSKTTEIDLLLIHETGLYVFEIKHYKGTIYGKSSDPIWTQYFRTAKNNTFKNPILQNQYHINSLRRRYLDLPIHSMIVFTADDCTLKIINDNDDIDVCQLDDVYSFLYLNFSSKENILTMENIDAIFDDLSQFSPMQKNILFDGCEKPFQAWIHPIISKLEEKNKELSQEKAALKKQKILGLFSSIAVGLICIIASILIVLGFKHGYDIATKRNNEELRTFKQNFIHVDEIESEYIKSLNSYISVSNVHLTNNTDHPSFKATLTIKNDTYGVVLQKDSTYIVMTDSGKVYEYNVFGEHLRYNQISNIIGKGYRTYGTLETAHFYGISSPNEINYIKMTNIQLIKLDITKTVIKDSLELELYSK